MKIKNKIICITKLSFLCIIALNSCFAIAQTDGKKTTRWTGTELWQGISIDKKLTKKWRFGLEENIRLGDSGRQFETGLLEASLSYKLLKKVKLKAAYRYSLKPMTTANTQRISVSATKKRKLSKRWRWSNRVKYQYGFVRNRAETSKVLRYKSALTYNIRKSKLNPFVSVEWFYRFYYKENEFNRYRLALGADYKWQKKQNISFVYMYESDLNENVRDFTNIFYIGYSFDL